MPELNTAELSATHYKHTYHGKWYEETKALKVLEPTGYIDRHFIYAYRDMNSYSFMILGIAAVGVLNNGLKHLVPAVLMCVGINWWWSTTYGGHGVSHFFSAISGYLLALWFTSKVSFLTKLICVLLIAQNLAFFAWDYSKNWTIGVAHKTGHLYPTIVGFVFGWLVMKVVKPRVYNL